MNKQLYALFLGMLILFASCSKDRDAPAPPKVQPAEGVYVISDGSSLPGTLSYYEFNTQTVVPDFYAAQNNKGDLGYIVNDMIIYGSKMYIVANVSSTVTVADKYTAKNIKTIYFTSDGTAKGTKYAPRYVASYNGKILVSAWNGTVSVIDTSSYQIVNVIKTGTNLETMAVYGNTLYVASSGGNTYPNLDSTVSIVDLSTMKEVKKVKVGLNPQRVMTDFKGNAYVLTWGLYGSTLPKIYKIDAATQAVTDSSASIDGSGAMSIYNDVLYFTGASNNPIVTLNTNNLKGSFIGFITDNTSVSPYGLNVDESNGDVYVTSTDYTNPGNVFCFDKNGKKKFEFTVDPAVFPNKVIFLRD